MTFWTRGPASRRPASGFSYLRLGGFFCLGDFYVPNNSVYFLLVLNSMNIDYKKLLTELEERRMPVAALAETARLDGIKFASLSRLNQAFRDRDPLPLRDEVAQQILNLWNEISMVQFWTYVLVGAPLKLDFSDGQKVYDGLLVMRRRMREEQENSNDSNATIPVATITATQGQST